MAAVDGNWTPMKISRNVSLILALMGIATGVLADQPKAVVIITVDALRAYSIKFYRYERPPTYE